MINLKIMRFLDYWIGCPLCFLFSFLYKMLPQKKKNQTGKKKFLFIEISEMGSIILAYPAFKHLLIKYPDAELHFLSFHKNKYAVKILNLFSNQNIWTIRDDSLIFFLKDTFKLIFKLYHMNFDAVFDMELFSRFSAILSFFSRSACQIGFYAYEMEGLYRGNLLSHKVLYNSHVHMKENFLSLVRAFNCDPFNQPLLKKQVNLKEIELPCWNSADSDIQMILKKCDPDETCLNDNTRIIIVKPGGGLLPVRSWPLSNYIQFIRKCLEKQDLMIVIIGLENEKKDAEVILNSVQDARVVDLTGQTTFEEVLHLFNAAHFLITNDGGPAHFASMTNIPSIVFFGPETASLYAPLGKNQISLSSQFACSPCLSAYNHRQTRCLDNQCLKAIEVEKVVDIMNRNLPGNLSRKTD